MAVSDHPQGYLCEFIDPVSDDYYCKKCTLVARKLTFTSCCGDSYCHACIADTLLQAKPCSACGVENFETYPQIKFQQRIRNLQVYCSMKRRGCGWCGTLEQLDTHLNPDLDNCQYVDASCPFNCKQTIPKNKMEQHVAEECVQEQEEHTRQNTHKHLTITAAAAVKMNLQLLQKIEEQEQKIQQQKLKLDKQEQQKQQGKLKLENILQKLEQLIKQQEKKNEEMVNRHFISNQKVCPLLSLC